MKAVLKETDSSFPYGFYIVMFEMYKAADRLLFDFLALKKASFAQFSTFCLTLGHTFPYPSPTANRKVCARPRQKNEQVALGRQNYTA